MHTGQKCPRVCGVGRSWTLNELCLQLVPLKKSPRERDVGNTVVETRLCRATLSCSVHKRACKRVTARRPGSIKKLRPGSIRAAQLGAQSTHRTAISGATRSPLSSTKPPKKLEGQSGPTPPGPQRARLDRPADVWIPLGRTWFLKPGVSRSPPVSALPRGTHVRRRHLHPEPCGITKIPNGRSTTQPTGAIRTVSVSHQWFPTGTQAGGETRTHIGQVDPQRHQS